MPKHRDSVEKGSPFAVRGRFAMAAVLALVVTAISLVVSGIASSEDRTTASLRSSTLEQRVIPGPRQAGFQRLRIGSAEAHVVRDGGLGTPQPGREARRVSLLYLGQLSDFQLADEESPARIEAVDPPGDSIRFNGAWRPQEALHPPIVDAQVRRLNAFASASPVAGREGSQRAMDAVINTGDAADNQQLNETRWARILMEGGPLDPNSGIATSGKRRSLCPPGRRPGHREAGRYTGVQDYGDSPGGPDGRFYDPDSPHGPYRSWPRYPGLLDRAQRPFRATGLTVPSYITFGNHDAIVQGSLRASRALQRIATGCLKALTLPGRRSLTGALAALRPAALRGRTARSRVMAVPPDPRRRLISKRQFKHVFALGRQADAHGFGLVDPAENAASAGAAGYYSFSPVPGIRMISLDTVSEGGVPGHSTVGGNIDHPQFLWLERELGKAVAANELVVLFSHHPVRTLNSTMPDERASCTRGSHRAGCDLDPRNSRPLHLGPSMLQLLGQYPNVIAWVAGHMHANMIEPYGAPGGSGFWMIGTASEVDWPQQSRLLEIFDNRDGTLSIFGTVVDHAGPASTPASGTPARGFSQLQLASIGRALSYNDPRAGAPACLPCRLGRPIDRNVELIVRDPRQRPAQANR